MSRVAVVQFGLVWRLYFPDPKLDPGPVWGLSLNPKPHLGSSPVWVWFRYFPMPNWVRTQTSNSRHMTRDTSLFLCTPRQHFLTHIHLLPSNPTPFFPSLPLLSNSPYKLCPQWWQGQQWFNNVATVACQHCEGQSTSQHPSTMA